MISIGACVGFCAIILILGIFIGALVTIVIALVNGAKGYNVDDLEGTVSPTTRPAK